MHAVAAAPGRVPSELLYGEFVRHIPVGSVSLNTTYSPQYTGGGDGALIDGLQGAVDFRLGAWQGYEQNDLDVVVDLGGTKTVSDVALGCLQDNNSWIFFPTSLEVSLSEDGRDYGPAVIVRNDISPRDEGATRKEFEAHIGSVQARYVRIVARNIGICPDWHKGAGGKAWLFADEIVIRQR